MRIGILANTYRSAVGLTTGGSVHFIEVARRWGDDELTVFAPEAARPELSIALPRARFVAMPEVAGIKNWRLAAFARAFAGLRMRNELRKMDALFVSSHFIADVLPAVFALPSRTVVAMHHVLEPPWRRRGHFFSNTVGYVAQALSLALVRAFVPRLTSGAEYPFAQGRWVVRGKDTILSTNGVSRPPRPISAPSERTGAIYVGRLDPPKRVDDLIKAWAFLSAGLRKQRLHIVGEGSQEYRAELESLVQSLGLENVQFHGRVSDDVKWQLLDQASIFVFPSSEEGWGIAVAEALAAGLPCVTYNLPVYDGIFDSGRVAVKLGDVRALSDACNRLLSDDELRSRFAVDALELGRTFTWERAAIVERAALAFGATAVLKTTPCD
jgi:glycosyltransferase involved in cell wall biosynthesis